MAATGSEASAVYGSSLIQRIAAEKFAVVMLKTEIDETRLSNEPISADVSKAPTYLWVYRLHPALFYLVLFAAAFWLYSSYVVKSTDSGG